MWLETVEQCANMMAMNPYPGFNGQFFSMPCRNLVPKPVQTPHPPLRVACSNRETIRLAARLGIGALTFAFIDPSDAKTWTDEYYRVFKEECTPIGHAVNPQVAMVTGFSLHPDRAEALRRGLDGFRFFSHGLDHYYAKGVHRPGRSDLWADFEKSTEQAMRDTLGRGLGTPDDMRQHLRGFADAGVDQVVFIQQGGRNKHEHICESLELFAKAVMPEFRAEEEERQSKKGAELQPYIERAMRRKKFMNPIPDSEIPNIVALGVTATQARAQQAA
jgi:alkanesulfonate monooxygenase SsuD/methylene tetrahydromethanopterin reductase-like flavin-dependent oxidoreductase (luciferase family)